MQQERLCVVLGFLLALSISVAGAWANELPAPPLAQEDVVFIEMDVNKHEVYQGEPILLKMHLWRFKNRRIASGPYRGGIIVNPTTESFYVRDLEPETYEVMRGPWIYDVTVTHKLLYPTRSGDLQIGQWHWEGIALINRQSITEREKLYYKLDEGPIDIKVRELPDPAPGFTGAVGKFEVSSSSRIMESVTRGVPIEFDVTVSGWGNPESIGAPEFPELDWASVSDPSASVHFDENNDGAAPQVAKTFTYTLTPHKDGAARVPAFHFVYFSPEKGGYVRKLIGPVGPNVP